MVGSTGGVVGATLDATAWNKMLALIIAFVVTHGLVCASEEIPIAAIDGKDVKLSCNIRHSSPPNVEWLDFVYNSSPEPIVIFTSVDNPQRTIDSKHPNKVSYTVGSDFSLTIHRLKLDEDPGKYVCRSKADGKTIEKKYYLTIGNMPKCSGTTHYTTVRDESNEDDDQVPDHLDLTCESQYSGKNHPQLKWYRNGEPVKMVDLFELMLVKYGVQTKASHEDDQATYECRMTFGNFTDKCSLKLDVTYPLRELKFTPHREKHESGEELKCSAKGNPAPTITMRPVAPEFPFETRGDGVGWQSFIVDKSLEGQEVTVECTANQAGGESDPLTKLIMFQVIAPQKKTTHKPHHHTTLPQSEQSEGESKAVKGPGSGESRQVTVSIAMTFASFLVVLLSHL